MRRARLASLLVIGLLAAATVVAQTPPSARKRLLVIGEEKGYRHDAVSHAMATIERDVTPRPVPPVEKN